jgi:drug/metabolite transporter (DMT)-like permease
MSWIFLVLLYGLLKGGREIAKKKAMDKNSVMEVLFTYTLLSFILVIPQAPKAGGLEPKFYFLIALKSFCMFLAWLCSFNSLKRLPVSLYGVLSLSRVIFGTLLGVIFLHETMGVFQIVGLLLVCGGLLLLKVVDSRVKHENDIASPDTVSLSYSMRQSQSSEPTPFQPPFNQTSVFFIILAFLSCLFNSFSGFMDKILMKDITSSQLQFWYMLFIVFYYIIYILIKKIRLSWSVIKNGWIWALAIMFVIGDKALFIANGNPASKITIMTLIKQSACLVTIIGGKIFFHEKNIGRKLLCAAIIIAGIVIAGTLGK